MNSSNFIFFKNIDPEIYEEIRFIETNYKKEPKVTIGFARSILERYLKSLLINNGIESFKLQNILSNEEILQELNMSEKALEKKELIRKLGNKALHSSCNFTEDESLEVLKCLFFIFKELSYSLKIEFNENYIKSEDNKLIELEKKLNNLDKKIKLEEQLNSSNKTKNNFFKKGIFTLSILLIFSFIFAFNNKSQNIKKESNETLIKTNSKYSLKNKKRTKTTDEKLIEIIENNYKNYFKDPSDIDLNSYYFDINLDTSPYPIIQKEKNTDPYWLSNLDWLKWKKTKNNNIYIGNSKIKNMTPLLFTRILGWRGLIYSVYLIPESNNINTIIDFISRKEESTIDGMLNDMYEKIYPLNSDIFSFKNIFKYENQYYSLSREDEDIKELTSFVVYRLDTTPKEIIYEKALPSFKYTSTLTLDEKTVYFTPKLAILDKKMALLYNKARKSLTGINEKNLINDQRKFLKERKLLGKNKTKIIDLYLLRIKKIESELEKELKKNPYLSSTKINILKSLKGT